VDDLALFAAEAVVAEYAAESFEGGIGHAARVASGGVAAGRGLPPGLVGAASAATARSKQVAAEAAPTKGANECGYCNSDRSIHAFFSWMFRRWVIRSSVGASSASSATSSTLRALRQTASLPTTSWRTISRQSGACVAPGSSRIEVSLLNSA